jgi:ABC-type transporter Mla MlaB component
MLRITVHDEPGVITFQLEGKLIGPWVQVLVECWQRVLVRQRQSAICVDLTDVTSVDAAGQACLAGLHRQGAEFVAADCLSKAVVEEIRQAALLCCGRAIDTGERRPKRNRGAT